MSILILISGQDEDFLEQTVSSALSSAKNPEALSFGIVEQRSDDNFSKLKNSDNIKILKIKTLPIGIGAAKSRSLDFYNGEKYTLVVDPHTIFVKDWDYELINRYESVVLELGKKTIVSQYLHWAMVENKTLKIHPHTENLPAWSLKFDGLLNVVEDIPSEKDYVIHYSISGYYIFGYSDIFQRLKFDPEIYFLTEELMYTMRLVSRGYNIVALNYNPMYHWIKERVRSDNDWKKNWNVERTVSDVSKLLDAIEGQVFGYWTSPDKESLEKFLVLSGINLGNLSKVCEDMSYTDRKNFILNLVEKIFTGNDIWTALYDITGNSISNEEIIF